MKPSDLDPDALERARGVRTINLPPSAVGLRLARIDRKENLLLCEAVRFERGLAAVETTLRRAAISGRMEVAGEIVNHFADVLDGGGDTVETVALDGKSYSALKNHWMRCKVDNALVPELKPGVTGKGEGKS